MSFPARSADKSNGRSVRRASLAYKGRECHFYVKESRWLEFGTAVLTVEVETGYIRQEVSKGPP